MKIVIELNDADLHTAVKQEVDRAIASITSEQIEKRVNEIITAKFERISPADIQVAIDRVSHQEIKKTLTYGKSLEAILRDAAMTVTREALRRG